MSQDFVDQIRDLLSKREVIRLAYYPGHRVTHRFPKDKNSIAQSRKKRLDHSLRVAYISYALARFLRVNKRNTARAGLLHDCGFDPDSAEHPMTQVVKHASRGAEIASAQGEPQEIVKAISSHMFPLSPRNPPSSGQSLILWFADKIDSFLEYIGLSIILDKRINQSVDLKSPVLMKQIS
jgi:putative nucleotidyltransferase with HDIG domain